jgi:hypothetical protein
MTATSPTSSYSGLIKDFISPAIPTSSATWNYNFTISPTAPSSVFGKTCYFVWSYTSWQNNLSDASSGFTSVLEKSGAIKVGKAVVLNEILYNPKSTDPAPANKEFIELYNNSNVAIDVAGWQVSEISGSTEQKYTITTSTSGSYRAVPYSGSMIISAKGWMTLVLSDTTALNNTGDTVRLYDASNNKLDEHTYDGGKPAGFSEARMPDGVGAWVDPIPTPGSSNELPPLVEPIVDILIPEVEANTISDAQVTTDDTTTSAEDSVVEQKVAPTENIEDAILEIVTVEPAVEVPVVETPIVEVPVVEAPIVEAPIVEIPAVEAPIVEAPASE